MSLKEIFTILAGLGLSPIDSDVSSLSERGGLTVEEALWRVAEGVPSPNFKRFVLIVTEAARSGARLPEVLNIGTNICITSSATFWATGSWTQ
ncbi:MAG: hypothetical protein ACK4SY_05170 [Pyrobaculum sp.]